MKEYILQLPTFEGPLDLLLHFVRTRDVDIRNLPIAPICHEYLEFLQACEEIDLAPSSEWLAMAARLIYIKSCTLLPSRGLDEAPGSECYWPDVEDPKTALIRELLERERLMAIRQVLPVMRLKEERSLASFRRQAGNEFEVDEKVTYELGELGIYDLLDLWRGVLIRREKKRPMEMEIRHLKLSEVIKELLSRFLPKGASRFFRALLPQKFVLHQAVMTFLAILELARTGRVKLYQSDPTDLLTVERIR
ncbi:MAG: segregation/condensation protein A [bacterium]